MSFFGCSSRLSLAVAACALTLACEEDSGSANSPTGSAAGNGATSTSGTGTMSSSAGNGSGTVNGSSGGAGTVAGQEPGVLVNGMPPPSSGDSTAPPCVPDPGVLSCEEDGVSEDLRWIYETGTSSCTRLSGQCTARGDSYDNLRDCRRACGNPVPEGLPGYCFSDANGFSVALAEYCVLVAPDVITCNNRLDNLDEKYACEDLNPDAGVPDGPLPAGIDARRTTGCGRTMYEFAGPGMVEQRFYNGNNLSGGVTVAGSAFGTCNSASYSAGVTSFDCDPLANYDPDSGEPPEEIIVSLCTLIPPMMDEN